MFFLTEKCKIGEKAKKNEAKYVRWACTQIQAPKILYEYDNSNTTLSGTLSKTLPVTFNIILNISAH